MYSDLILILEQETKDDPVESDVSVNLSLSKVSIYYFPLCHSCNPSFFMLFFQAEDEDEAEADDSDKDDADKSDDKDDDQHVSPLTF